MASVEVKMMVLVVALAEAKVMPALLVATMVLASTAASKGTDDCPSHIIIFANLHIAT